MESKEINMNPSESGPLDHQTTSFDNHFIPSTIPMIHMHSDNHSMASLQRSDVSNSSDNSSGIIYSTATKTSKDPPGSKEGETDPENVQVIKSELTKAATVYSQILDVRQSIESWVTKLLEDLT